MIDQFSRYQRARGFSSQTIRRRRSTLHMFERFIEPTALTDATQADIEEWLASRKAARTRHANRSDLRVFYRWAVRRHLVASNPAELVESVKVPKSLPKPLGADVYVALLVGRRRTRRMVALGLYAGLRAAEIANLDGADVALHLDPPLLSVRNGKGGKDRVIPVHPVLAELLADGPRCGPVFPNADGRAVLPNSVSRTVKAHLARVGSIAVSGRRPTCHQLRHTFGTEFARESGGDLVALANLMGHASTNTTMGYVGWSGESADVIGRMFDRTSA